MFASVDELSEGLRSVGYIADPVTVSTVYLAANLHKPVLIEGAAGSGKTQLAYAVAGALRSELERLQCYQGIDEAKAIGKFDDSLQRLCAELKAKSSNVDWQSAGSELHSRQFFVAGPLLRALEWVRNLVTALCCFGLSGILRLAEFWVQNGTAGVR